MTETRTRQQGVYARHRKGCPAPEGRCRCSPSYVARVTRRGLTSCVPSPTPRSLNISGNGIRVTGNSWVQTAFVYPGTGTVANNSGMGTSGNCSSYAWTSNVWNQGGC